jgi:hypothetical protein
MKKFKTPGTPPVNIQKRNAWFAKLSDAQKRVAICEDVKLQLKLGKLEAESGTYFSALSDEGLFLDPSVQKISDAQTLIEKEGVVCHVCARGGIFASKCRLGNEALNPCRGYGTDFHQQESSTRELFPYYTNLESLFECSRNTCGAYSYGTEEGVRMASAGVRWINKHGNKSDRVRMTLLMDSIIKNQGDLVIYGVKM